jgi:CheY-like chemotaxis protein
VLIVEDEAVVRAVTRRALEQSGFEVVEAHDGATARARLRDGTTFDVVLMDVSLPDETGPEIARDCAREPGAPPFVFMSGYGVDDIVIPEDVDAAGFLEKPFTLEDVKSAVLRARR